MAPQVQGPMGATGDARIDVLDFTDPYCSWCWASEPMRLRLVERYSHVVKVHMVMGGLVDDLGAMPDAQRLMWLRRHLPEVADHSWQPIDAGIVDRVDRPHFSTWPSCIHAKAAYLQSEEAGDRLLRRFRLAVMTERRDASDPGEAIRLARDVPGLDTMAWQNSLSDGSALASFQRDRAVCQATGVQGFPTLLLRQGDRGVLLPGHRPSAQVEDALRQAIPGLVPLPPAPMDEIVDRHGPLTTRELSEVHGVPEERLVPELENLVADGAMTRVPVPGGLLWSKNEG